MLDDFPACSEESEFGMHSAIRRLNGQRLKSYEADPGLIRVHYGIGETVLASRYGYRQALELVQNGADALLENQQQSGAHRGHSRIYVRLHCQRLYVANTGVPLGEEGVDALLRSHSSPERGNQIGRFGLGLKSLLKLSTTFVSQAPSGPYRVGIMVEMQASGYQVYSEPSTLY